MSGIRLLDLQVSDMLDVIHHLMIEDLVPHATVQVADDRVELQHRARVRETVEELLDGTVTPDSIAGADPETWGTSPEQQAALASAMAQFGPQSGGAKS